MNHNEHRFEDLSLGHPGVTPYQIAVMTALPQDGTPAAVGRNAAFALRAIPQLCRVEEDRSEQRLQNYGVLNPPAPTYTACLLAAGIELLARLPHPRKSRKERSR